MVILRSQNKITDFLMILVWLCRFKLNIWMSAAILYFVILIRAVFGFYNNHKYI